MSTLTAMKARIAAEIRRSNLTSEIASAITTAIEAYQHRPWAFQQSRSTTFNTAIGTEFYTSGLSSLIRIDRVFIRDGNVVDRLDPMDPQQMEEMSENATSTGKPSDWSWYAEQLRLYPVPDAVYPIRVAGIFKVAAPATDGEANNPWMTTAERLIRARAKWELAVHVIRGEGGAELATAMAAAIDEAERQIIKRSNDRTRGAGFVRPYC